MQTPDLIVPFPRSRLPARLRAELDAEARRLRSSGVCEFKWIPEEPDDIALAEIELDEEEDAPAAPEPKERQGRVYPRRVQPSTPQERQAVAERVATLLREYPDLAPAIVFRMAAGETGRDASTVRRWHREVMGIRAASVQPSTPDERLAAVSQVEALLRADPHMCREDAYRQVGEAVGRPGNTVGKWFHRSLKGTLL